MTLTDPKSPQAEATSADLDALKKRVHESLGSIVITLANVPRYQHLPLGEIRAHLLEPLVRNRIATANVTDQDDPHRTGLAGVAIWASVSEEVDAKIRAQIKAGVFPLRLAPTDWTSGQVHWLLDVIAGDKQTAASIVHNLQKALPKGQMHLHPLVTSQLDADALAAMGQKKTPLDA